MARSPLVIILSAVVLFLVLAGFNISHHLNPSIAELWQHASSTLPSLGLTATVPHGEEYLIGVGKADITGPVAEINFMGYADPGQLGTGLRQRLYSRAFIVGDVNEPKDRFVYLVLDTQSGDTAIRHGILEALEGLGGEYRVYGRRNVAVTGTHSHSGPGAWLNYLLPQITSKGFHKPSYQAIVDGAVASIKIAHERLAAGHLSVGEVDVHDANVNRSPYAYLANPSEERARYEHDVDKTMTVLRFSHNTQDGIRDIGILTWFAVHGTSMQGNNTLVTGDNKGVAAGLFEKSINDPSFVAGFSQANVGDTSPNILGAYCETGEQAGQMCDFETSLCGNRTQPCHGRGPYFGRDDSGTASTYEIGTRQYKGARRLFDDRDAFKPVQGKVVKSLHQFVDLSNYHFILPNGTAAHTCPAALGYSFAAGTSDGPGAFDFKQGQPNDPHANPLWSAIRNRIHKPNDTQKACHREKVILLDVGESYSPYAWSPNIVDLQLFRVGQFIMILSPGEATTMAGRRWRDSIQKSAATTFTDLVTSASKPVVVLGGPANTYSHYIATPEEYTVQRYESASTLYGPFTLDAYLNLSLTYLPHLGASVRKLPILKPGPEPPILINESLSFITPVVLDRAPLFKNFGDVLTDVRASYRRGQTVSATFVGANPRNDLRLGGTFAAVEKLDPRSGVWERFRDDADWSLVYAWKRTSSALATSEVTVQWEMKWETGEWRDWPNEDEDDTTTHPEHELDQDAVDGKEDEDDPAAHTELLARRGDAASLPGTYRLRYFGDAKGLNGRIQAFDGTSAEFRVE